MGGTIADLTTRKVCSVKRLSLSFVRIYSRIQILVANLLAYFEQWTSIFPFKLSSNRWSISLSFRDDRQTDGQRGHYYSCPHIVAGKLLITCSRTQWCLVFNGQAYLLSHSSQTVRKQPSKMRISQDVIYNHQRWTTANAPQPLFTQQQRRETQPL